MKIIGVCFTYDRRRREELNFDEILKDKNIQNFEKMARNGDSLRTLQ